MNPFLKHQRRYQLLCHSPIGRLSPAQLLVTPSEGRVKLEDVNICPLFPTFGHFINPQQQRRRECYWRFRVPCDPCVGICSTLCVPLCCSVNGSLDDAASLVAVVGCDGCCVRWHALNCPLECAATGSDPKLAVGLKHGQWNARLTGQLTALLSAPWAMYNGSYDELAEPWEEAAVSVVYRVHNGTALVAVRKRRPCALLQWPHSHTLAHTHTRCTPHAQLRRMCMLIVSSPITAPLF